jgi:hypothetical protein
MSRGPITAGFPSSVPFFKISIALAKLPLISDFNVDSENLL